MRASANYSGLPWTIVFYDLSNTHYSGRENGGLRRCGKSQQKRNDCPLVSLTMAWDGSGFPRRCEILAGNVSQPGTLQPLAERLDAGRQEGAPRTTVVLDAGLAVAARASAGRAAGADARGDAWSSSTRSRCSRGAVPGGGGTFHTECAVRSG